MKIAVPTKENVVSDHFGHSDSYAIFSVDEKGKIVNTEILPAIAGCGCKSNVAGMLKEMGVKVLLAGNIGEGAYNHLSIDGIRVYRGCSGEALKLTEDYIQGKVKDNGSGCHHHKHGEGHQCSH